MVAEMKWDDADECYVSLALGQARDSFLRIDRQFTGPELVMEAIKTTIDIDGRFVAATPEGPKRLKAQRWGGWLHTEEEAEEIFKQRMFDVANGESIEKVFGFNVEASPDELLMKDSVIRVFRLCLRQRPPYLHCENRGGKSVWYVRIGRGSKGKRICLHSVYDTPEFKAEYDAAIADIAPNWEQEAKEQVDRDWRILRLWAYADMNAVAIIKGQRQKVRHSEIGRITGVTQSMAADLKAKQSVAIWRQVERLLPPQAPEIHLLGDIHYGHAA